MKIRIILLFFIIFILFTGCSSKKEQEDIFTAISKGNIESVSRFLMDDADINQKDNTGNTPLIMAVKKGDLAIIKLLITKGADTDITGPDGKTAFRTAEQRLGQYHAITTLLGDRNEAGEDENKEEQEADEKESLVLLSEEIQKIMETEIRKINQSISRLSGRIKTNTEETSETNTIMEENLASLILAIEEIIEEEIKGQQEILLEEIRKLTNTSGVLNLTDLIEELEKSE